MSETDSTGLRHELRRLRWQSCLQMGALALLAAGGLAAFASGPGSLTVRELIVVDDEGVERVRISGDVPDAVVDGRRLIRGEKAAGIILYDAAGRERSGFATFEPSGNVMLTLDNRQSEQNALFVAGPDNAAALRLWQGRDALDLRTDSAGTRMTIVRDGQVLDQTPATPMPAEACQAYRDAVGRIGRERTVSECQGRFVTEACTTCLE